MVSLSSGKHTGDKRRDANNRQTAHGRAHHKLFRLLPGSNNEEKQHDKVGAYSCQCHNQRKGADKQAKRLMIVPPDLINVA